MKQLTFLMAIIFLTACGSGPGTPSSAQNLPPPAPSVQEAVIAAEASGTIPKLDRSTSLLGTDADGNGVRDDIDTYINSLPDTVVQKAALRQSAAALNTAMTVDTGNPAAIEAASVKTANAAGCNQVVYGDAAWKHSKEILKYVVNTKERFDAYMKFNQALSGKMLYSPSKGVGCAQ